jgi:ATP-binding cassette, subfamily C (CFTR/MRP), member 1
MPDFEKEVALPEQDPHTALQSTRTPEPVDDEPLTRNGSSEHDIEKVVPDKEYGELKVQNSGNGVKRPSDMSRIQSGVSAVTSITEDDSASQKSVHQGKRKWYRRLNPLKRSRKPPVPESRRVSREHDAGFFSLLTFQWMAPLMAVSCAFVVRLSL